MTETAHSDAPDPDARAAAQSRRVALIVASAFFMQILDGSIITTAIPQMAASFGVAPAEMSLGVTSYLLAVAHEAGLKRILIPLPFAVWHALIWIAEMLPSPPITRNQVELMQVDTVASPAMPGFEELGISPHSVENMLEQMLRSR